MSNKIKGITLTGFRAFSDERNLSFETQNGVADIVVIHAPNGTGKTSTIEAMEWAVTGKISRIKDIAQNTGGKNFKPKEGYILKNRNYQGLTGKVNIELDSGNRIIRKTLPLANKNSDYNPGEVLSFIDNMKSFKNNILSQGYISKFSYEASNGSLFKSLIESQSKGNSEDIVLYDKINGLKSKLDAAAQARESEIRYIEKSISNNENELKELKDKVVINSDFSKSSDYDFFKQNFSLYKDISNKNYDESVSYLKGLQPGLTNLKEKLLNFNIDDYKVSFRSFLKSNKIISLNTKIDEAKSRKEKLVKESEQEYLEKEIISKYLLESNLKVLVSDTKKYERNTSKISELNKSINNKRKALSSISQKMSNIRFDKLHGQSEVIEGIESDLDTLFPDPSEYSDIVYDPEEMLKNNSSVITSKRIELSRLDFNYFLSLKANEDISKEISDKRKRFSGLESKLKSLIEEKKNTVSFEEKLALIKSYVVEAVNDKNLTDCPACGFGYVNKESLLEAVNSLELNSKSLLDGAINNLTDERNEVSNEISLLNDKVEQALSNERSLLNDHINNLGDRGEKLESLFSAIRSLGIEPNREVNLQEVVQLVFDKEAFLRKLISISYKRKKKYETWLTSLEHLLIVDKSHLQHSSLIQQEIQTYYLTHMGLNIDKVILDVNYLHVTMYKQYLSSSKLKAIENKIYEVESELKNLHVDLNTSSTNFSYLDHDDCEEISRNSLVEIKTIRADYNFIKRNINEFKISTSGDMIDFILRFNESVTVYLSHILVLQDIEVKSTIVNESTEDLERIRNELLETKNTLGKVKLSIDETKDYFTMVASESINNDILNDMFMYVEPHLKYDKITFRVDIKNKSKGIYIQAGSSSSNEQNTPVYYLSEAQINILSICIFLAQHARNVESSINTIVIDDPVQSMDDLNSYALIDLCKIFSRRFNKQIIITTHNRSFFNLFKNKLPENRYPTKFISL
ncbi:AAA family ATPase [Vibrio sp. 10N.239.311.G01]|uniref:AAA family ATPase n=1 Tax=Vibrio sp. 10N.239.311.G01 TaxID=3229976 RepID=UPI00354B577D